MTELSSLHIERLSFNMQGWRCSFVENYSWNLTLLTKRQLARNLRDMPSLKASDAEFVG